MRRSAAPIACYTLLALLVFPVFPHFVSPNEFTRWALAAAIVEDRSIEITRFVAMLGGGNFEDVSQSNGRLYSNKAPGAALVGLPGYAVARVVVGPPTPSTMRWTLSAMRVAAATLPLLFLAWAFARAGGRVTPLLFATPLFAYGLLNFSHALAAAALFGAWMLLFVDDRPLLAGVLIGLAALSEYPTAIGGAVLIACAWRRAHRIIAGAIPFAIMLALYNRIAFGSFLTLSSGSERNAAFRQIAGEGLFGVGVPKITTLLRLLFDPARGLFIFSPILVVALLALPHAWRAMRASALIALLLVPISILLLYSGYPNWHGGWSVGPRYLVPAIPFLLFPLAYTRPTRLEAMLLGASAVAVVGTSLMFPFPDVSFPLPWATVGGSLLQQGLVAPNLLHFVARALAITVPFALVTLAVAISSQDRGWLAAGAAAMIAISVGYVQLRPPSLTQRLRIGFIEEVYFERTGAMQGALPGGAPLPPRAVARAEQEKRLPPTSWPF
jgi:hypothetical protein